MYNDQTTIDNKKRNLKRNERIANKIMMVKNLHEDRKLEKGKMKPIMERR